MHRNYLPDLEEGMLLTVLREKLRQQGKSRKMEGDTIAGKWRTGCFMTLVDRKTRFLVGKKLDDHRAETLKESICSSLNGLPCRTLTVDNGKEFVAHKDITVESKAQVYFAHPHSPWERPTNENTNGPLRQYFPKYTSFLTVTQEHLDYAIHLFNNRPQKCLNWKTPYQALAEELLHLV